MYKQQGAVFSNNEMSLNGRGVIIGLLFVDNAYTWAVTKKFASTLPFVFSLRLPPWRQSPSKCRD
jgi:hypothetical protein